jgi:hypothetical protein
MDYILLKVFKRNFIKEEWGKKKGEKIFQVLTNIARVEDQTNKK